MQAFLVSLIGGCLFPILPVLVEFGLTNAVRLETLAVTSTVYAAAVGMASRNQAIAFSSFFFSLICIVIYSAETYKTPAQEGMPFIKYGALISGGIMLIYFASYVIERFSRHYIESEPYVEF